MYAIPTPGRSVPIPGTRKLLPAPGQNIGPLTQYWLRRLQDGDITVSPTAPAPIAATPSPMAPPASLPAASPAVLGTNDVAQAASWSNGNVSA